MKQPVFIRLENSLAKAKEYKNSPQMEYFSFEGVQLIPNNPYPYIQRTYAREGISISTYEVKVKSVDCNEELGDITDYFEVISSFDDSDTGLNQVYWSISPEQPLDFGNTLVYLEILTAGDSYIYSSPFFYTETDSQFVARIDYRDSETLPMSSIGLVMYYREQGEEMEIENYTRVTDGALRTNFVQMTEFEFWQIGVIDVNLYRLIKYALTRRFVFVDLQRTFVKEGFDTPRLQADENFAEQEIQLVRDENQMYDPNEVPIIPIPPVLPPEITLFYVKVSGVNKAEYTFTWENFDPSYLVLQVSTDNIDWSLYNDAFSPVLSPRENSYTISNLLTEGYYFRIIYPPLDVKSNFTQLQLSQGEIIGGTKISPTVYDLDWYVNYPLSIGNTLFWEFSNDSVKWAKADYLEGNVSPKRITTYPMSPEPRFFRFTDLRENIMSNVFELEDGTT